MRCSTLVLSFVLSLSLLSVSQAGFIFSNTIDGDDPSSANPFTAGQQVATGLTVSGIGFNDVGLLANSGDDRYNLRGWSTASVLDESDFITFSLTPNAGQTLSLRNFQFTGQVSASGPKTLSFRSSVDNFLSEIASPVLLGETIDLSASGFQNLNTPVEFRLFGFGATSASGTFSVNDFSFSGSLSSVPEPNSLVLLGLGACSFVLRRRR